MFCVITWNRYTKWWAKTLRRCQNGLSTHWSTYKWYKLCWHWCQLSLWKIIKSNQCCFKLLSKRAWLWEKLIFYCLKVWISSNWCWLWTYSIKIGWSSQKRKICQWRKYHRKYLWLGWRIYRLFHLKKSLESWCIYNRLHVFKQFFIGSNVFFSFILGH